MSEETKYDKLLGIISQMQMIKCRIDRRAVTIQDIKDGTVRNKYLFDWIYGLEKNSELLDRGLMIEMIVRVLSGEQIDDMAKLDVLLRDVAKGGWYE